MSNPNPIIWTPSQRETVIGFLRQYADELEKVKDMEEYQYGLQAIQAGVLHLADKVLPSGLKYTVNQGPERSILENVPVIYSDQDAVSFENKRAGESDN